MVRKARRGVPHECQGGVEIDRDPLMAEISGHAVHISPEEVPRRRMDDRIDRLREIDDHRAFVPPEHVERRQIPVHELGVQDQPDLALVKK